MTAATPAPPPRDHRDGQVTPGQAAGSDWWVCDGILPPHGTGQKIIGPFATQELALNVRTYVEKAGQRTDLWVDDEPATPQPAPGLAAAMAERDKLQRSCRLLAGVLVSQARSLYGAWIEASRGDLSAMREWVLNGMPDVDDNDPGDQWNGTETADEWFDRTQDEGDAPKPQAQAVSSLRALLDHETRIIWDAGLPGERARVATVREQAGLEALT